MGLQSPPTRFLPKPGPGVKTTEKRDQWRAEWLEQADPKQKPWNARRAEAMDVARAYEAAGGYANLRRRIDECATWVLFQTTGALDELTLEAVPTCKVRTCPVCTWRRSLKLKARLEERLPEALKNYPTARFILLTLTVRNCEIADLRTTLQGMTEAWKTFNQLKEFRSVQGWIKTTEVTRAKDRRAHPHYHALMMVPASYYSGTDYVNHDKWQAAWRLALKADYNPFIRADAIKKGDHMRALPEITKYGTKAADLTADPDWLAQYTGQVRAMKFVATGGAFNGILKDAGDDTDPDIKEGEAKQDENSKRVTFDWKPTARRYARRSTGTGSP